MRIVWKSLAAVVGGLMLATMAALVVGLATASDAGDAGSIGAAAFWIVWLVGVVVAFKSPSAGKAWRYLLISCALLALAMPLSSMIFAGSHVAEYSSQGSGAAVGSVIGGGMVAATTGIVGFFMAAIFLIVGLLVGKDRPAA